MRRRSKMKRRPLKRCKAASKAWRTALRGGRITTPRGFALPGAHRCHGFALWVRPSKPKWKDAGSARTYRWSWPIGSPRHTPRGSRWVWPPTTNRTGGTIQRKKTFWTSLAPAGDASFVRRDASAITIDRGLPLRSSRAGGRARSATRVLILSGRAVGPSKRPRGPNRGRGVSTASASGRQIGESSR
jgi:hypothetical protein